MAKKVKTGGFDVWKSDGFNRLSGQEMRFDGPESLFVEAILSGKPTVEYQGRIVVSDYHTADHETQERIEKKIKDEVVREMVSVAEKYGDVLRPCEPYNIWSSDDPTAVAAKGATIEPRVGRAYFFSQVYENTRRRS